MYRIIIIVGEYSIVLQRQCTLEAACFVTDAVVFVNRSTNATAYAVRWGQLLIVIVEAQTTQGTSKVIG